MTKVTEIPINEAPTAPQAIPVQRILPGNDAVVTPAELLAAWRRDVREVIEGRRL